MNMVKLSVVVAAVLAQTVIGVTPAEAQDRVTVAPPEGSVLPELVSGYYFLTKEAQALQDDDSANSGFLWIEHGDELWSVVEGEAGNACADCHGNAAVTMRAAGTSYPKFHEPSGKLINLEQRINLCRTENMAAPAWEWESDELLAMTAYLRHQSRGLPMSVGIDGPARPFFDKGKAFFHRRLGLLDMSCAQCHDLNYGKRLRANLLSQGHTNGYPTYRLGWQNLGSLHRMFQVCNKRLRATPYEVGAEEYVNLELYMAWRGTDLPVETPAVRP